MISLVRAANAKELAYRRFVIAEHGDETGDIF